MRRIEWIDHEGSRILFEDMSGLWDSADICAVSDASNALICKELIICLVDYRRH
jgi:hypothetical protein